MRGKRSKQYRKLMNHYALTFGFREPYQVLVDAQMVKDAKAFKMDLLLGLERTLHGKVKPMITQCSMRHLYETASTDQESISIAKNFERRRCNHHTLEKPLTTRQCWQDVIDAKESYTNKHRYVVATQGPEIRAWLRQIPGVPLIYVNRSVMIMEPMTEVSEGQRTKEEREKFRQGLPTKGPSAQSGKRKRVEEGFDSGATPALTDLRRREGSQKGVKGPNPLSMKKKKAGPIERQPRAPRDAGEVAGHEVGDQPDAEAPMKKRKRKPSSMKHSEQPVEIAVI